MYNFKQMLQKIKPSFDFLKNNYGKVILTSIWILFSVDIINRLGVECPNYIINGDLVINSIICMGLLLIGIHTTLTMIFKLFNRRY